MVLAAPIEQVPVYAPAGAGYQEAPPPSHHHGRQRSAAEAYPHQPPPMFHPKERTGLHPLRSQRPYVMAQPGCVPADILQEFSSRLAEILDNNPAAAYLDLHHGDMAYVDHHLFLGAYRHAENGTELLRQGVTHVLNCARSCCPNHDENFYAPHGMVVLSLDASDTADFPLMHLLFDKAFDFMEKCHRSPKAKCLIHCYQGLNRSATLCVAYLMVKHRLPLLTVVERVHAVRAYILGNPGFRQQLIEFAYVNELLFEANRHTSALKSPSRHSGLPLIPKKRKPVEAAAVVPLQQPQPQPQPQPPSPQPQPQSQPQPGPFGLAAPLQMVPASPLMGSPNVPLRQPQPQQECGYKSLRDVPVAPVPLEKKGRFVRMVSSLKDIHFGSRYRREAPVVDAPPSPAYVPLTPVHTFRVAA
eukprot:EG_transcript_8227